MLDLLCFSLLAVHLAAPLSHGAEESIERVELDPPDALLAEVQQLLETVPIQPFTERLVARKELDKGDLPFPNAVPTGTVTLQVSERRIPESERFVTRAGWLTNVPKAVDSQFVYHLHVAHLVGGEYRSGHRTWGVAMTQFNGTTYNSSVSGTATEVGDHRVLGILCALSIKTRQVFVLDVVEATYSVTGGTPYEKR
jgi:hypothetical protein